MARLATLCEASAMRIGVAIGALAEGDSHVARFAVRSGRMTLLASNLCVQPSQWVARLRMVKLPHADGFPIVVGMALKTILAQSSIVLVLVACNAGRGDTEKCFIQILDFDDRALRLRNVFSRVTTIARQPGVLALK